MPAIAEEIEAALEEGVALQELVLPVRIENGVLSCVRMKSGEPDASGRRRPVVDPDSGFTIACDLVILAIGQEPDLSLFADAEVIRDEGHHLVGIGTVPVILCGDLAGNEGTVAAAMGTGMRSAWRVHRAMTGEDLFPSERPPVAGPDAIRPGFFAPVPQQRGEVLPLSMRTRGFGEVHFDFSGGAAAIEASRCFSCGVCSTCDLCLEHCPEGIVTRRQDGYRFNYDYCKGCGICEAICPRGVIGMA